MNKRPALPRLPDPRRHSRRLSLVVIGLLASAPAAYAAGTSLLGEVQTLETGGESSPYTTVTSVGGGTSIGAFQQKYAALEDIGYYENGSFTAASGVSSLAAYEQCSSCQVAAETAILKKDWSYLESNGTVSTYMGSNQDGITWNESALIECAQQLGATGCKNYLETGVNNSGNPHLLADIAAASETDSSAITGEATTAVDNYGAITSDAQISSGTAEASILSYCSKQIAALISEMARSNVNNAALIAENGATGFTMSDGSGVVSSLTSSGGSTLTSDTGTGTFLKNSCLTNLFSNLLPSAIFQLPSLSSILSQIENAACNAMNSEVTTLVQPVSDTLGTVSSDIDSTQSTLLASSLGGGGFFPGLSLGYLGFTGGSSDSSSSSSGLSYTSNASSSNFSLNFSASSLLNGSAPLSNGVSSAGATGASSIYSPLF